MITPTFIDLFCGCGGFTLGLQRAGFQALAAIDFEPAAMKIYHANFKSVAHALERDLTKFSPDDLEELIGNKKVDLIVGGPPCQGFSIARQVDGANHGNRLKDDNRRRLYQKFLDHVNHFRPKVFVMENVLGIRSADGGLYFSKVQAEARALGYKVHAQLEECVKLGVPQKRRRQLFIGTRDDLPGYFKPQLNLPKRAMMGTTLWDALADLPTLKAGSGEEQSCYDDARRTKCFERKEAHNYIFNVLEVSKSESLTAHRARPHNDRDLRDFKKLKTGESSAEAMRRGVKFEFPYDKNSFKDRFTRQPKNGPCSTIVAHLSKDGLMFIHPTQNRSLTPREAARIQSFPDWFLMPVARTHQFKAIGNAVPPLVSEAIGEAVKGFLASLEHDFTVLDKKNQLISHPTSDAEAASKILELIDLSPTDLKSVGSKQFNVVWYSIAFFYQGLHPDSISQHGKEETNDAVIPDSHANFDERLFNPYHTQSGWPLALHSISIEGLRRYENGDMSEDEFYNYQGQRAGYYSRKIKSKALQPA